MSVRWLLVALFSLSALGSTPLAQAQSSPQGSLPELPFKDFYKLPIGPKGLEMSEKLLASNGRAVQLTGYMVQQEAGLPGQFILTPRPVQMSEHADGEADDLPAALVLVMLAPAQQEWVVPHIQGLIQLHGLLHVGRLEASDGRISWVQLQLDAGATRAIATTDSSRHVGVPTHSH